MFRKFTYLLALARERHFGRAAAACHVAQPTLSNAIRQLEEELRAPIVERDHRFLKFTPEGEKVLDYARRIIGDYENLLQDLNAAAGGLEGQLRLGVIPTALPMAAYLIAPFTAAHPGVRATVLSMSSRDIQRGLDSFELDAGVTYLDNEPLSHVRMQPLYSERYFLLTRAGALTENRNEISWAEAADLPLCLLTTDMQNRRIADAAFAMVGRRVTPALETNSLLNLYTMALQGGCASIVPSQLLTLAPLPEGVTALPLTTPDLTYVVGVVYADRTPPAPAAKALAAVASAQRLASRIPQLTRQALARNGVVSPAARATPLG